VDRDRTGLAAIDPRREFSVDKVPLPHTKPFGLPAGAVFPNPDLTVSDAWEAIMNDAFLTCLTELARSKPGGAEITRDDARVYAIAVIAVGLARRPQERDIWRKNLDDLPGILGARYIQDLVSRDKWISWKQMFTGNREKLTDAFNTTASPGNFVVPNRYDFRI